MTFVGRLEVELDVWHRILFAEYSFQASFFTSGTLRIFENVDHIHISIAFDGILNRCAHLRTCCLERCARLDISA